MGKCEHLELELRGHKKPAGIKEGDIWISNPSLLCLGCGAHLLSSPADLTRIKNIPHPSPEWCSHPPEALVFPLDGFGAHSCLQCGKDMGIASPSCRLEIINEKYSHGATVTGFPEPKANVGIGDGGMIFSCNNEETDRGDRLFVGPSPIGTSRPSRKYVPSSSPKETKRRARNTGIFVFAAGVVIGVCLARWASR